MPCSRADAVQRFEQLRRRSCARPFTDTGMPFSNPMVTSPGLSGASLGALGEHPDFVRRGVGRVFERAALVRDVPDVAVAAVDLGGGGGDGHVVRRGVVDGVLARNDVPLAPRRDHRKLRRQRLVGQLEADLVVALAGAAVGQRVAAGLRAPLPPASWPAADARWRCPAGTCARRRRRSAPAARGTRRRTPRACPRRRLPRRRSCGPSLRGPASSSPPCPISPQTATTSQP